ncbi:MAG: cytidine deaminase [Bacteroidia bacterium]|nr:MAG: cytidine deaminase [Bacteroidia bacterium]
MATFQFEYHKYSTHHELILPHQQLISAARRVALQAYAPYSHFKVGAAVLLANNKIIEGVNIENASYPVGICAERAALSSAISQFPHETIHALAISIIAPSGANNSPAFPCGMCRQFISECEDRNAAAIPIILSGQSGEVWLIQTSKHLLPFSFSGKDLK